MLSAVLAASALLPACGGEAAVYRDLPVVIDGAHSPGYRSGPPEIVVGDFEAGSFRALADGDGLRILHGVQGGRWIHLGVRVRGVSGRTGELSVHVETTDAAQVSVVEARQSVRPTPRAGWLELRQGQFNVALADQAVEELAGRAARLIVGYDAGGDRASVSLGVVLLDG